MQDVLAFYDEHPINEAQILAALARAGKTAASLRPEDLYPYDQDHYGGLEAVDRLADRVGLAAGKRLLDVCSGMGGPARYLATSRGAEVVGIELNGGRTLGARRLTEAVGLGGRVRFVRGDATRLPFADGVFDAALAQEAFLHIADKATLLGGCRRVLKSGGRFAFTDWIAFPGLDSAARQRLAGICATAIHGICATAIHGIAEYRGLLDRAGFADHAVEDLSPAWQDILRQRLEMFRAMQDDTVRLFGAERHRAYIGAYEFFVARIADGQLGGARFSATAP